MLPNKPYIIRAFYDWIVDSECTPYLVADTTVEYIEVPEEYIENNQILLNLSPVAVKDIEFHNRYISFSAQFSGEVKHIYIPIAAVIAIYAKENGRGMMFHSADEDSDHPMLEPVPKVSAESSGGDHDGSGGGGKSASHLKVVK